MEEMGACLLESMAKCVWSVGRIPRQQGGAWPVAQRVPGLGGAPGGDLGEEAAGEAVGGAGVDGEEVIRSSPPRALSKFLETASVGVSGTYPGVSVPSESLRCKPRTLWPSSTITPFMCKGHVI
jgi:hypothetical protein